MENKTVLIVNENEDILALYSSSLESKYYDLAVTNCGEEAFDLMHKTHVDLIISSFQLPKMNGMQLFEAAKRFEKNVMFVIMADISELVELKKAHKAGVNKFLPKPVSIKDMEKTIKDCLHISDLKKATDSTANKEEEYHGICVRNFIYGSSYNYPIYVKLHEGKYVKVGNAGKDLDPHRIEHYIQKGVEKLYLKTEDYEDYLLVTHELLESLQAQKSLIDNTKVIELVKDAGRIMAENILSGAIDEESYYEAEDIVKSVISLSLEDNDMLKLILQITEMGNTMYAHSLSVSLFATMLIKKLNWSSDRSQKLVSMGGLFHDVGKKFLHESMIDKKIISMSAEEKSEYEKHPLYSVEILESIRSIPDEVLTIIMQHHENCEGTGFPHRKHSTSIHPLAQVVALANDFVNAVFSFSDPNLEARQEKALRVIKFKKGKKYEEKYLICFFQLFGKDFKKTEVPQVQKIAV